MHTVLIIDDDPYIQKLIKRILETAGYGSIVANNGKDELVDKAKKMIHGARRPFLLRRDVKSYTIALHIVVMPMLFAL